MFWKKFLFFTGNWGGGGRSEQFKLEQKIRSSKLKDEFELRKVALNFFVFYKEILKMAFTSKHPTKNFGIEIKKIEIWGTR